MPKRSAPRDEDNDPGPEAEDHGLITSPAFLQFVEASAGGDIDPLSDEGLRLQAQYVREVGDHPLDVLKTLSKNPWVKPSDRISAAKALLEYGARKVPAQFELMGKDGSALRLDASLLAKLSDKELGTLEKLLAKAQA